MSVPNVTEAVEDEQDSKLHTEPELLEEASPTLERDVGYDLYTVPTPEEWQAMSGYASFISKLHLPSSS